MVTNCKDRPILTSVLLGKTLFSKCVRFPSFNTISIYINIAFLTCVNLAYLYYRINFKSMSIFYIFKYKYCFTATTSRVHYHTISHRLRHGNWQTLPTGSTTIYESRGTNAFVWREISIFV